MSRKCAVFLLVIIMLLSIGNFMYWAEQKSGFHCDEIYSHGLSNTEFHYRVFDDTGAIRWNTPEDIDDYLTVPTDARFDYINVFRNQISDVHPPLFYIIMHTAASIFPETYSVYYAILPNIAFILGTCVLVYLIAMNIMKKRSLALLAVICYAFSVNCINMAIYMRMYAQLTFFTTAAAYLYLRLSDSQYIISKKMAWALAIITFLGTYTQYYFLIFVFGFALLSVISMLWAKKKDLCLNYIKLMGITAGVYALLWPSVFKHLFASGRGNEAFQNLVVTSFPQNIKNYINVIRIGIGDILFWLFVAAIIITVVVLIKKGKFNKKYFSEHKNLYSILAVSVFYFVVIAKVAPFQTDRYISPIFPLFAVILVFFIHNIFAGKIQRVAVISMLVIAVAGLAFSSYNTLYKIEGSEKDINYLYRIPEDNQKLFSEHAGKKCVMVNSHEWQFLRNLPDYKNYSETAFVDAGAINKIKENNHLTDQNEFILYVSIYTDTDKVLEEIQQTLGFDSHELLVSANARNWANIYRVYKD